MKQAMKDNINQASRYAHAIATMDLVKETYRYSDYFENYSGNPEDTTSYVGIVTALASSITLLLGGQLR